MRNLVLILAIKPYHHLNELIKNAQKIQKYATEMYNAQKILYQKKGQAKMKRKIKKAKKK